MNEYRFDGLDAVVDQDGKIIYDDVTQRTGDIIAGLLENSEVYDAECDRLAAKLGDVMAEADALRQRVAELEPAQQWVPVKTAHYQDGQGIVIMTFHEQTISLLIRGHGLVHVALRGDHRLCASEGSE